MNLTERSPIVHREHLAGFTKLELLVALLILASMLAIVVILAPHIGHGDARQAAAKTQIAQFGAALNLFKTDLGYYPKGKNGLMDLLAPPREIPNWRGPYLSGAEIPKDPWGNDYVYECPGKHESKSYDLMSMGPDGRAGSKDDLKSW